MQIRQTKRTFYQFLRYYLLIALLPLSVIVVLLCNELFGRTRDYYTEHQADATINAVSILESHLSIINGFPQQLAQSSTVSDFRRNPETMNHIALVKELSRIVGGNELISNLMIYFRDTELIVSAYSNSWSKEDILNGLVLQYEKRSAHDVISSLNTIKKSLVFPAEPVRIGPLDVSKECISFLYSLPVNNRFAFATAIVLVDAQSFRNFIHLYDNDQYFLMDTSNSVVLSEGINGEDIAALQEQVTPFGQGVKEITVKSDHMVLSWAYTPSYGYTLVRLSSIQPLIDQRTNLLKLVFIILAGLSVLIVILILTVMRRTFTPISNLVKMTAENRNTPIRQGEGNAFTVIGQAITSLQTENNRLNVDIARRNPILAEYSARMMLSTPEDNWNQEAYDAGVMAGLPLNFRKYKVVVLEYQDSELLVSASEAVIDACGDHLVISFVEISRTRLVVLLGSNDTLSSDTWLDLMMPSCAGIGPIVNSVKQWNSSYIRASLACDCASDNGSQRKVMRFDEVPADFYTPSYPWETLQTLNAAINQANAETVRTAGDRIMNYISRYYVSSGETIRTVYQQAIQMFSASNPALVQEELNKLRLQPEKHSPDEMNRQLTLLLDSFCETAEDTANVRMNSPVYRSLQIISEELGSEELSLAYVADKVGLSASRYSTMFRLEMNVNFKEYVDSLRLTYAKQLLQDTDMQINLIGKKVGYSNAYSFNRFFKGKTGLTPSEYRGQV